MEVERRSSIAGMEIVRSGEGYLGEFRILFRLYGSVAGHRVRKPRMELAQCLDESGVANHVLDIVFTQASQISDQISSCQFLIAGVDPYSAKAPGMHSPLRWPLRFRSRRGRELRSWRLKAVILERKPKAMVRGKLCEHPRELSARVSSQAPRHEPGKLMEDV
ncbi:hypothetical protein HPP92_028866 [Vanilla planifolia]|uniref:Uncharacterized protein n=1 Tax=Vanilla planifolia TaxID=51239 RepID=A0A835P5R7_VANPL|nr:hypothetical protein HPP92_028866 [Vanilla planifolia]KAG0446383.1 hypothetical protein HPP92_028855 [Vanilla planifolia]